MRITKSWSEIQTKIRPSQALQDLTILEILEAFGVTERIQKLESWNNIDIHINSDVISLVVPNLPEESKVLHDETRDRIIEELVQFELQSAFGDGQEEEMVRGGTTCVGFHNMSDHELVEAYDYCYRRDGDLLEEANAQLATHKMLEDK